MASGVGVGRQSLRELVPEEGVPVQERDLLPFLQKGKMTDCFYFSFIFKVTLKRWCITKKIMIVAKHM